MSEYRYVYMHAPIAGLSKQVDCMKNIGEIANKMAHRCEAFALTFATAILFYGSL